MDKNDIIDMPIAEVYGPDSLDIDEVHVCVYGSPEWYQEEDIIPCFEDLQNYLHNMTTEENTTNNELNEQKDTQVEDTKKTSKN